MPSKTLEKRIYTYIDRQKEMRLHFFLSDQNMLNGCNELEAIYL